MDIKKMILYLVAALLGVTIWNQWKRDFPPMHPAVAAQAAAQVGSGSAADSSHFVPATFYDGTQSSSTHTAAQGARAMQPAADASSQLVTVTTDVLRLKIDPKGGDIVEADLLKYPVSLGEKQQPVKLLNAQSETFYVAQSGVTGAGIKAPIHYQARQANYTLGDDQNALFVVLYGKAANGLSVEKRFTFHRDRYAVNTEIAVTNGGTQAWRGSIYHQLLRRNIPPSGFNARSYYGPAISSAETPYEKLPFKKLNEKSLSRNIQGGWVAMQEHYFLSAWIPKGSPRSHYYSHNVGDGEDGEGNLFTVGFVGSQPALGPGETRTQKATLYLGPELENRLKPLGHGLELTIDYGWLAPISILLFWVMSHLFEIVRNWGWAIVLVTLTIKLVFYWFSQKSFESMAKMREAQPRIEALRARYGDDKQALSRATMDFYRKEKLNPMGGCLPMLIQIPVFFALYYVLIESVALRQAPFIFWIHDLSLKDPFFVLPILMGLSMLVQQKLSPPPPDPTQAKMMMFLPIIFTAFFFTFPAGLVLYWLTNNCLSVLHQWWVIKTYDPRKAKQKKKKR